MIMITLSSMVDDAETAVRVVETFGRVMAGMAFEGIVVSMNMQDVEITPSVGAEDFEGPS